MSPGQLVSSVKIVEDSWGPDAPNWIKQLAQESDATSQASVAKKIGRSPSLVNQVLKNKYKAGLDEIKSRVEAVLGCKFVECPIVGTITSEECLHHQDQPFAPYNHVRVSLFRACKTCPFKVKKEGVKSAEAK